MTNHFFNLSETARPLLVFLAFSLVNAARGSAQTAAPFEFIFPLENVTNYPADEMIENCGGDTFDGASAEARFQFLGDSSTVEIEVAGARPNTVYTAWLRLGVGGSPLTGAGSTALADPSQIVELGTFTPTNNLTPAAMAAGLSGDDGSGSPMVANGFMTDANGSGLLKVDLSFDLADGVYPFTEFHPEIADMPLGSSPFAIRVVSHCVDNAGHGLAAGRREAWFDLRAIPVPEPSTATFLLSTLFAFGIGRRYRK